MQTQKGIFKKADEDGRDPYLALLEYRNTPVSCLQYIPSQMLMSKQTAPIEAANDADIVATEHGRCTLLPDVSTAATEDVLRQVCIAYAAAESW